MLINDEFVDSAQNMVVTANKINIDKSLLRTPTVSKYAYYNSLKMEMEFRDNYNNRLNQIELKEEFANSETLKFTWSLP